ncbi:MAG: hypothetical protein AABX65_00630 [Nanoarchaeota archaeon]
MGKREAIILLILFLAVFMLSFASALSNSSGINSDIQKVTSYAEDYETGNINYIQLMVYLSSIKQSLNQKLGAAEMRDGGLLKEEQIKEVLGEQFDETKWVWVEGENREKKFDRPVPTWRKIIFDGKTIQIRLSAYPSIFNRCKKFQYEENSKDSENPEEKPAEGECVDSLIYRLNFETEFKKQEEQIDFSGKIDYIKSFAEKLNSDPSSENSEALARESVNAEKTFESYFRSNQGKCEDVMISIFGSENQRDKQKMTASDISFYNGDNFEAKLRIEMCDDCQWNWISVNIWIEGKGPNFKMPKDFKDMNSESGDPREKYKGMTSESFKTEVKTVIENIKSSLEKNDIESAYRGINQLNIINEAWNEKSNNVWEEVNKNFVSKQQTLQGKELEDFNRNYGWIKEEQEKRKLVSELSKKNYEERKQFYNELFSGYDKREFYYEQTEFEKRLIENFKENGQEICNNNIDDNKNEKVDCDDNQCGGKICGETKAEIILGNETVEEKRKLYCISNICQLRDELIKEEKPVCGNHICEAGEKEDSSCLDKNNTECNKGCPGDCSVCPEYPPLNCTGKVIFSGKDENKCPLKPVCMEENKYCTANEDCFQPLCGISECVEGVCQITELKECKESECVDGEEKTIKCNSGEELISARCVDGLWKEISTQECGGVEESIQEEEIVGSECTIKGDCGNENDVCSNGKCITLPEKEEQTEEQEQIESEQQSNELPEEQEQTETGQSGETPTTGQSILNIFRTATGKIIGYVITGFAEEGEENIPNAETIPNAGQPVEEQKREEPSSPEQNQPVNSQPPPASGCHDAGQPPQVNENCWYEKRVDEKGCVSGYDVRCKEQRDENNIKRDEERKYEERRSEEDKERRENDCSDRCNRECNDRIVMPCVDKCIRESGCMDKGNCDDSKIKECEDNCKSEKNIDSCVSECNEKCLKGEDTWIEPEWQENKEEKGVFVAGGSCRTSQQNQKGTEGFIWFSGWGEPFGKIQQLKNKYYMGGNSEWCKLELENLKKERKEIEENFNQEFAEWFFEKYIPNTADNWEEHVSGIFEMYWRVVDNQRRIIEMHGCLEQNNLENYRLINFSYETEYGSVEYWEELKQINPDDLKFGDKNSEGSESSEKITVISPYMKIWVFPPSEFIKYEMKKAMKEHEFPGSPEEKTERKNEEGPTEEEREMIKQDKDFMEKLGELVSKYDDKSADITIQVKDYEKDEIVFNIYGQINEQDIIKMKPMLPEEVPEKDITVTVDYKKIYELIYDGEKEMSGQRVETPPWDREKFNPVSKVKDITKGIKMYFRVRSLINSAEITPSESEDDVRSMFKTFFSMMMKNDGGKPQNKEEADKMKEDGTEGDNSGEAPWEDKKVLTGEVILD